MSTSQPPCKINQAPSALLRPPSDLPERSQSVSPFQEIDAAAARITQARNGKGSVRLKPVTIRPSIFPGDEASSPMVQSTAFEHDSDDEDTHERQPMLGRDASPRPPSLTKPAPEEGKLVTWLSLPRKKQLFLLVFCRLSEPLSSTSLLSYLYYFIKSLPGSNTTELISRRAGLLVASFAFSQFITGMMWGRLSDIYGRKPVIVLGLLGSVLGSAGLGFSQNFAMAVSCRIMSGVGNGTVGVLRTMVAETIREKKYQSRAFLLLPLCFNCGIILGPMLGGLLAEPVSSYPGLFGPGSPFDGTALERLLEKYPYSLPNLVSAIALCISLLAASIGLEETLVTDYGIAAFRSWCHQRVVRLGYLIGIVKRPEYSLIANDPTSRHSLDVRPTTPKKQRKPLPIRQVFTPTVIACLISFSILPLHNSTFMNLFPIFLSSPRVDNSHLKNPFLFGGGLGLSASDVGFGMSILGSIGIVLQLFCYPPIQARLGNLRSYRYFLGLFPIAYLCVPFLAIIPSKSPPPDGATGVGVWCGIVFILMLQVTARTFALPGNVILLINSVEDRRALGTVNGLGSSVSSLSRAIGPLSAGWAFGLSLRHGVVGAVWWIFAVIAVCGAVFSWWVQEGKGFAEKEDEQEGEQEERVERDEDRR